MLAGGSLREIRVVLPQASQPAALLRPGRREGGPRAHLQATPEGQAVLVSARRQLAEVLDADGLVPLATLRLKRGLSQQQLANLSGILQPQLSRIESGAHDIMMSTATRLARALGVPVAEVVNAVLASRPESDDERDV